LCRAECPEGASLSTMLKQREMPAKEAVFAAVAVVVAVVVVVVVVAVVAAVVAAAASLAGKMDRQRRRSPESVASGASVKAAADRAPAADFLENRLEQGCLAYEKGMPRQMLVLKATLSLMR